MNFNVSLSIVVDVNDDSLVFKVCFIIRYYIIHTVVLGAIIEKNFFYYTIIRASNSDKSQVPKGTKESVKRE